MSQSDRVADHSGMEEDTECVVVLKQETLIGIVEGRATGPRECRAAEEYGNMPVEPRVMGGSVNIVTDGWNGVDVYLALRLNGRRVYGLLDTGCDTSVASHRIVPNELLNRQYRNYSTPMERKSPCSVKWISL